MNVGWNFRREHLALYQRSHYCGFGVFARFYCALRARGNLNSFVLTTPLRRYVANGSDHAQTFR